MKFTITPESGDSIILTDTTNNQTIGWYLVDSVVEGWYGTPGPRESVLESNAHDGDQFPPILTQGARIVTIYGALECQSNLEATMMIGRINALFGQKLEVAGEDATGRKRCTGYLSDDPCPTFLPGERIVKFVLVITCPYPVKLSDEVVFTSSNGGCSVTNMGNVQTYPKIRVPGRITSLRASFNGHVVTWTGNTDSLEIDLYDLSCNSGQIVEDDSFAVPPGSHSVSISTTPYIDGVEIAVSSGWR